MTTGSVDDNAAMTAVALSGLRAGKSVWEIAVELYGADRVAADRGYDGWMRAKVRRLAQRARAASDARPDSAGPGTR